MKEETMGRIIAKTGIKREKGCLYFITKSGDVAQVQMKQCEEKRKKKWIIIKKMGIKKKKGRLYYVDKKGNIGETSLVIERKKPKKRNK